MEKKLLSKTFFMTIILLAKNVSNFFRLSNILSTDAETTLSFETLTTPPPLRVTSPTKKGTGCFYSPLTERGSSSKGQFEMFTFVRFHEILKSCNRFNIFQCMYFNKIHFALIRFNSF